MRSCEQTDTLTQPKADAKPATSHWSRETPVTLYLKDFDVPTGSYANRLTDDYVQVSVALTGELDPNGFVIDNRSFVIAVTHNADMRQVPGWVSAYAQHAVGSRLARAEITVRYPHKNKTKVEAYQREGFAVTPQPTDSVDCDNLRAAARLADNAVCGGYNGEFVYDLRLVFSGERPGKLYIESKVQSDFDLGMLKASCEELAGGLVNSVQFCSPLAVVARVYNLTGYAEVCWKAGMRVPDFPRLATPDEMLRTRDSEPRRC